MATLKLSLAFWEAQPPIEVAGYSHVVRSAQIKALKVAIFQTEQGIRILEKDNA